MIQGLAFSALSVAETCRKKKETCIANRGGHVSTMMLPEDYRVMLLNGILLNNCFCKFISRFQGFFFNNNY